MKPSTRKSRAVKIVALSAAGAVIVLGGIGAATAPQWLGAVNSTSPAGSSQAPTTQAPPAKPVQLTVAPLNGAKEVVSVKIAKDAMDPEDPSMLEDLILAAFKDAAAKVDEAMKSEMGGMGGGLNLPGIKF